MIIVADYEQELWWASLVDLASGATTSLVSGRPLFASGYTNPIGSFDVELAASSLFTNQVLDDRVYIDNYRVVIRPSLPIEISAEVRQSVTLRFESFPGRRYRILSGPTLNNLEPTGEPFYGTGEIIERSFLADDSGVFFRVVESGD